MLPNIKNAAIRLYIFFELLAIPHRLANLWLLLLEREQPGALHLEFANFPLKLLNLLLLSVNDLFLYKTILALALEERSEFARLIIHRLTLFDFVTFSDSIDLEAVRGTRISGLARCSYALNVLLPVWNVWPQWGLFLT